MTVNKTDEVKRKSLHAAAKLFLSKGYTNSTVRDIAAEAGVGLSGMTVEAGTVILFRLEVSPW